MNTKKIEMLYHFINDTQNTIRFLDTKAGAILVFMGVIITIIVAQISNIGSYLTLSLWPGKIILIILVTSMIWFFIRTALFCMNVIQSKTISIDKIEIKRYTTKDLGFLSRIDIHQASKKVYEQINSMKSDDEILKELIHDYIKVSSIRETKMQGLDYSMKHLKGFLLFSFSILFAELFLRIIIGR